MIIELLILIVVLLIALPLLHIVSNQAGQVHRQLSNYKILAYKAETVEQLENLKATVIIYAKEKCWHKHLSSHAEKVIAYIDRRLKNEAT